MTFKAPDSLSEQIADYLAERIIRGELAPGERIQEQKVTQALNVSRGSVREALLILERRHLVAILPRRGAHVTQLDERSVRSLCSLMGEFYILLGNAVAQKWRTEADLRPFLEIQQRLQRAHDQLDIKTFVADSFAVMRAAYPFADNPFLQNRGKPAAGHEPCLLPVAGPAPGQHDRLSRPVRPLARSRGLA